MGGAASAPKAARVTLVQPAPPPVNAPVDPQLQEAVSQLHSTVSALTAQVANLNQQVSSLQQENSSLKVQLASVRTERDRLGTPSSSGGQASSKGVSTSDQDSVADLALRLQRLEAMLTSSSNNMKDDEAQRAAEEFAKQMKKLEAAGIPITSGAKGQGSKSPEPGGVFADAAALPNGNNFSKKLLPTSSSIKQRQLGRGEAGSGSGKSDQSMFQPGATFAPVPADPPGMVANDLNATRKFGSALPSDFKLAEQMKRGNGLPGAPRQGFL